MAEETDPKPLGKLYRNKQENKVEVFVLRSCWTWVDEEWRDGVVFYYASDNKEPLEWHVDTRVNFDQEFELIS